MESSFVSSKTKGKGKRKRKRKREDEKEEDSEKEDKGNVTRVVKKPKNENPKVKE